jgi:hypothetical protein
MSAIEEIKRNTAHPSTGHPEAAFQAEGPLAVHGGSEARERLDAPLAGCARPRRGTPE